jgi:maltose alpha-D-glucosyltransferase/alpha-amylase
VIEVAFLGGARPERYSLALAASAAGVREAVAGDGAWRALAVAIADGRTIPAVARDAGTQGMPGPVTAALVCRPAPGMSTLEPGGARAVAALEERRLDADQSNTSVVLGDTLLLKAYRRLEPGLNPDLELTAYLTEEIEFAAVPRLAGFAELVTVDGAATVAMLQEFRAGGEDAYETTAERIAGWLLAPREVTVEFATEEASELGWLTADLHAALSAGRVPGFEPREATTAEVRGWWQGARAQLDRALEVVTGDARDELRRMAPAIAEELTTLRALTAVPILTRVHGDYHLGQVLRTADGFALVDFEGEPTRSLDDRRQHGSPLRDVASMLRSLDHVGRSAERRAVERAGGPLARAGLDLPAWFARSRQRFLDSYVGRLREHGSSIVLDADLVRALEIEKETYEFVYAATYLPEWTWVPLAGMRGLLAERS